VERGEVGGRGRTGPAAVAPRPVHISDLVEGRPACEIGTIRATPAEPSCPRNRRAWVLLTSVFGSGLAFLLATAETVALPGIQVAFGASAAGMLWVVNGYLLFLGALVLAGGSAGDRFGKRRVFVLGVSIFGAATLACGLAPGPVELVIARMVQGAGGALLVPNSLALIGAAYPEDERGRAIGTWSAASALTTALGPVVGGVLVDALSWRWTFFAVVPLAVVTAALALLRVPVFPPTTRGRLDLAGAVLATLGLGALSLGLIRSAEVGSRDAGVVAALGVGLALLAAFVIHEARTPNPMMPTSLFRSRVFSGANAMTVLLYGALTAAMFFLPFNLIQVQGYEAAAAGLALLPLTALLGLLSRWAGGLKDRVGPRIPLTVGSLLAAAGFALLALGTGGGSYWAAFFPGLVVLGAGLAVAVAPLTTVVFDAAPRGREGIASGINNAAARVAGLLAVAALGAVAIGSFAGELDAHLERLDLPAPLRAEMRARASDLAAAEPPPGTRPELRSAIEGAVDASFLSAYRGAMAACAVLAALAAGCAAAAIRLPRT
jgi:EmrB/QacA subfamily drug resistance transporter